MRRLETTRLTVALISSKAAPRGKTTFSLLNLALIHLFTLSGTSSEIPAAVLVLKRTRILAILEEPNISSPAS